MLGSKKRSSPVIWVSSTDWSVSSTDWSVSSNPFAHRCKSPLHLSVVWSCRAAFPIPIPPYSDFMVRTHLHAACSLDIEFSFQHRFPSLTPYVFRQFSLTTCCLTSLPSALQVIHMMHIHSVEIILLMLNLDRTAPCIWALCRAAQQHSPFPLTRLLWCTQTFVLSTNWMLVCKWISFSNRLFA